jgi:UDP-N-acetylglucosamine--N-acetylmuramyl-(pentapeptide) pyrophosphoryl-undecaprenol N-acetylglucosamine transferase
LSKFANKICISFESSRSFFPKEKTVLTGNPIRKTIMNPAAKFKTESSTPIIYITGGSLGSHFINSLVSENLAKLLDKYTIIHQTGGATEFNDFEKLNILRDGLNRNKDRYIISKFFSTEEIGSILKSSALVVSRAGINSVSEIIVLKKPALLIPLPVSQKDEQLSNALLVKKVGLGEVFLQKELNPEIFLQKVNEMMKDIEKYKFNSNERNFPKNAAKKIVDIIYEIRPDSN